MILGRLGLKSAERVETVLALLDERTPSGFAFLADAGVALAAGATTRHLLDYISQHLGKGRMDRELRDSIMLPLREVGILRRGYASVKERTIIEDYWKPKSPHNVYVLDDDFRSLVMEPKSRFERGVDQWLGRKATRLARVASAESSAAAEREDSRLERIVAEQYCRRYLPEYRIVFVDDSDGERISAKFREAVEGLNIPLDLSTRWPDIVLNRTSTNHCWVVECVETDGEVDTVRREEMIQAFSASGLEIDGFTTAYRTARRFAERQRRVDNIASSTYIWIAELGGAQFLKEALVDLR